MRRHPCDVLAVAALMLVSYPLSHAAADPVCDQFASRVFTVILQRALGQLNCGDLGRAGLDHAEHHVDAVCYSSSGPTSQLSLDAMLACKTSPAAFIKATVTAHAYGSVTVSGADCSIADLSITSPDAVGRLLLKRFDAEGAARKVLQDQLAAACRAP